MLEINLLGSFRLRMGGKVFTGIDSPRLQSFLAYLLLHLDAPVPRKQLAYIYWPDATESQAHNNLRGLFYRLRKVLPNADEYIEFTNSWIRWRPDSLYTLDVKQFYEAVEKSKSTSILGNQKAALTSVVDLYTGDLLPGCYEDWIFPIRDQIQEIFLLKLNNLIEILENQREFSESIRYAQKYLRYRQLEEDAYRRLMRLHAVCNDRASGLHVYHTCVRVLQNELGVSPSYETQALYEQLLSARAPLSKGLPDNRTPFVGRITSWKKLVSYWRKQATGQHRPGMVVIVGEAGIGKTRLAEEFINWAQRQGITTASAHAYPTDRQLVYVPVISWLQYLPIKELPEVWLAEIARLAPDIIGEISQSVKGKDFDENWQRRRILEALRQAVVFQKKPTLLFLDDVQWADSETIEWIHYLLRTSKEERLLVLITLRKDSLYPNHPLQVCLADLEHTNNLLEINLGALSQDNCRELTESITHGVLSDNVYEKLFKLSEGNPLFLEEAVRAIGIEKIPGDGLTEIYNNNLLNLSPKIQNLLISRLDQLSPKTRSIIDIASVLGRSFSGSVLASAAEVSDDDLLYSLDELWKRGIVRELDGDLYDFSHDLLRQCAFSALSPARRQLYHRRAAEALKSVYSNRQDVISNQVAIQYDAGGLFMESIYWYRCAAQHARKVFALQEAAAYLRRALELIPRTNTNREQTLLLCEELGDVCFLSGKHTDARILYQKGLIEINSTENLSDFMRLWHKIANVEKSALRYVESSSAYEKALSAVRLNDSVLDDKFLSDWIDIKLDQLDLLYFQNRQDEMAEAITILKPIISSSGSVIQNSNFVSIQAEHLSRQERFILSEKTLNFCLQAYELALESGEPNQIAYKRFSLGFVMLWHGDWKGAEEFLKKSLEEARLIGHIPLQDRCLAYLCILYRMQGRTESLQAIVRDLFDVAQLEGNNVYLGVAKVSQAWLAWKIGDQAQAHLLGRQALTDFMSSVYPFHWLALFILMEIALSQNDLHQAVILAADTLAPTQQRLPIDLNDVLQSAINAWEQGEKSKTRDHLEKAVNLAQNLNFL